jgi:hypothetical protein
MKPASILIAFVLFACEPGPVSGPPTETASQQVLTTASQPQVEACRAESEIASSLEAFARAVNNGDRAGVEVAVSSAAQWFSLTTPAGHEVAYGHNNMVEHLISMHLAGDRFVTPPTPNQLTLVAWDGAGHFGLAPFSFERGGKRMELQGKGAVYCGGRLRGVEVLSLGG